jgi:hypothetical protein
MFRGEAELSRGIRYSKGDLADVFPVRHHQRGERSNTAVTVIGPRVFSSPSSGDLPMLRRLPAPLRSDDQRRSLKGGLGPNHGPQKGWER